MTYIYMNRILFYIYDLIHDQLIMWWRNSLQKHNNIFMYFTEKFKELYLWYYKLLGPEGLEVWK